MERIVSLGARSYPLYIERGALRCLSPRVNLARKVLLVTDEGVPESLRTLVLSQCGQGFLEVLPMTARAFPPASASAPGCCGRTSPARTWSWPWAAA